MLEQKVGFLAAFGWFLVDYKPKSSSICTKLSMVMECKAKYDTCYSFWYSAENSRKRNQKSDFWTFFGRFFDHTLPNLMGHAQIFRQMKIRMMIHNRGKFHLCSISGCQVINFQKFSWRWSMHELRHFGGVLRPDTPKYVRILIRLAPEVVFKKGKTMF